MTFRATRPDIDAFDEDGAGGNLRRDVRRRGYTVRYTGDDARYDTRPGTAKPLTTDALCDGDPMDCELYPVVWRQEAATAAA